jgi:hypothetical protein
MYKLTVQVSSATPADSNTEMALFSPREMKGTAANVTAMPSEKISIQNTFSERFSGGRSPVFLLPGDSKSIALQT